MALAGKYNMTIDQGATLALQMTYKDSAGDLINLSGYSARMQVRQTVPSTSTILDLTTANGGLILGGAAGTIDVAITATASEAVAAGQYVYDLELVNGTTVERLVMGTFTCRGEVTR